MADIDASLAALNLAEAGGATADFFAGASIQAPVTINGKEGFGIIKDTALLFFNKKPEKTEEPDALYNIETAKLAEGNGALTLTGAGATELKLESPELNQWRDAIKAVGSSSSLTNLTPDQESALQKLVDRVTQEGVTVGEAKQRTELVRFLKAHKWDIDATYEEFMNYKRWRTAFGVDTLKMKDVHKELMEGKVEIPGTFDKAGRPIVIFRPRAHEPNKSTPVSLMQMAAYIFESQLELSPNQQITVVVDMNGLTKEAVDLRLPKTMLEVVLHRYPNSVGLYCIVNQPLFFTTIYAVISGWLSNEMRAKVHMIGGNLNRLHTFIDPASLPADLGGKLEFNFRDWIRLRYKSEGWDLQKQETKDTSKAEEMRAKFLEYLASEPSAEEVVSGAVLSGHIFKEGGWIKSFKKQFFVLKDNAIFYYKDEKSKKPEGMISLINARVEDGSKQIKQPYSFLLVTTLRTYYFYLPTEKELKDWLAAINDQIMKI